MHTYQKRVNISRSTDQTDKHDLQNMRFIGTKAKNEADFTEVTKYCINITVMWLNNEAAGTQAFVPDVNDRDECYAIFQIYLYVPSRSHRSPQPSLWVSGERKATGFTKLCWKISGGGREPTFH